MKNLKQIILPAVIVLMGTGAAFATNQAKKAGWDPGDPIYRIDQEQPCTLVEDFECSNVIGNLCTYQPGVHLYGMDEISGTACNIQLFEKTN